MLGEGRTGSRARGVRSCAGCVVRVRAFGRRRRFRGRQRFSSPGRAASRDEIPADRRGKPRSILSACCAACHGWATCVEETWALLSLARERRAEGVGPDGIRRIARDGRCPTDPGRARRRPRPARWTQARREADTRAWYRRCLPSRRRRYRATAPAEKSPRSPGPGRAPLPGGSPGRHRDADSKARSDQGGFSCSFAAVIDARSRCRVGWPTPYAGKVCWVLFLRHERRCPDLAGDVPGVGSFPPLEPERVCLPKGSRGI